MVRSDLPVGFLAAQVVHAAGESSPGNLDPGTNAVVLAVASEPELIAVAERLRNAAVPHVAVCEPDAPWNGAMTAIGVAPVRDRAPLKRILAKLPLLR